MDVGRTAFLIFSLCSATDRFNCSKTKYLCRIVTIRNRKCLEIYYVCSKKKKKRGEKTSSIRRKSARETTSDENVPPPPRCRNMNVSSFCVLHGYHGSGKRLCEKCTDFAVHFAVSLNSARHRVCPLLP